MKWVLFALLCIFQWIDITQTYMLIDLGIPEGNPIVQYFIDQFGTLKGMIIIKIIVMLFLLQVMIYTNKKYS